MDKPVCFGLAYAGEVAFCRFLRINGGRLRMARMYSRDKGYSGSKRPNRSSTPSWIRYKPKEIEMLVVKLGKEGYNSANIGLILRDSYGIPDVKEATGKKITKILEEKKLLSEIPEDLMNVIKKNIRVRKHLEENNTDMVAKRGFQLAESRIKRLAKYYKETGKLSKEWKYDPEKVRLLIE